MAAIQRPVRRSGAKGRRIKKGEIKATATRMSYKPSSETAGAYRAAQFVLCATFMVVDALMSATRLLLNPAGQRTRLTRATFMQRSASIDLAFADGYCGTLAVERLEMPLDRIRWGTTDVSQDGKDMVVTAKKGELIPISAETIRYLADARYAAEVHARHQELLYSDAESDAYDEPPPSWFTKPQVDLRMESLK